MSDPVALALRYALSPATEPPPPDRESDTPHWHGPAAAEAQALRQEIARLHERIRELLFQLGGEP